MGICSPCCTGSTDHDEVGVHKSGFVKMMETNPLEKFRDPGSEYVYDKAALNMMEIWESKVFGGSAFRKIGKKNGGFMTNYLKKKVLDFKIEYLYGGGYYKIENLPDPENN